MQGPQPVSRFSLQWLLPREESRLTHVMLLDTDRPAPYIVAAGHGADKAQALLHLWQTLKENHESTETVDFVAAAYTSRTGKVPAPQR